jgi:hypothetical protein
MSVWTFYDNWRAFPFTKPDDRVKDPRKVGHLQICLDGDNGSEGEFHIEFFDFSAFREPPKIYARMQVYGDTWKALAASGDLINLLGDLPRDEQTQEEVTAVLLSLGFRDRTAELRGTHPAFCHACHGKGTLDDIGIPASTPGVTP